LKSLSKETPQTIGIINSDNFKGNHSSINDNSRIGVVSNNKNPSISKDQRRTEKTEPHKKNEEEIKKDMNSLIEKQNSEMLKLLEDEQEL
jgi:hypothetical protein